MVPPGRLLRGHVRLLRGHGTEPSVLAAGLVGSVRARGRRPSRLRVHPEPAEDVPARTQPSADVAHALRTGDSRLVADTGAGFGGGGVRGRPSARMVATEGAGMVVAPRAQPRGPTAAGRGSTVPTSGRRGHRAAVDRPVRTGGGVRLLCTMGRDIRVGGLLAPDP